MQHPNSRSNIIVYRRLAIFRAHASTCTISRYFVRTRVKLRKLKSSQCSQVCERHYKSQVQCTCNSLPSILYDLGVYSSLVAVGPSSTETVCTLPWSICISGSKKCMHMFIMVRFGKTDTFSRSGVVNRRRMLVQPMYYPCGQGLLAVCFFASTPLLMKRDGQEKKV
jgi:hypothetical protein